MRAVKFAVLVCVLTLAAGCAPDDAPKPADGNSPKPPQDSGAAGDAPKGKMKGVGGRGIPTEKQ